MFELTAPNNAHPGLDKRTYIIIYKSSLPIKLPQGVFPGTRVKLTQLTAYESLVSDKVIKIKFPPLKDKEAKVLSVWPWSERQL